ncbi:ABC transporter ATP-binding protein [Dactylosporangium sp. NPDC051485]|uniref:ABC transporter ATP-binding protein n=1 Tax=Dactylosporangium sp. NPDC051485 TaxID=3154846 RepID=UPI0034265C54
MVELSGARAMTDAHTSADGSIRFRDVGINFTPKQRGEWVLRHLDLEIGDNEFFVIVGPSGCGKSTLLRVLAGIAKPTEGYAQTGRGVVDGPGPDRAMVFQSVDTPLMEWLNVRRNVEYGLRMQGVPRSARSATVDQYLRKVGLHRAASKYPHQLSGGMKQRVQIARVLASNPSVLLMDEPFAALDAQTRRLLQRELVSLWQDEPRTVIYVTHDIREAVLLGTKVAVMTAPPQSTIRTTYEIAMPYPRDEFAPEFVELASKVEADIEEEVSKLWAGDGFESQSRS